MEDHVKWTRLTRTEQSITGKDDQLDVPFINGHMVAPLHVYSGVLCITRQNVYIQISLQIYFTQVSYY